MIYRNVIREIIMKKVLFRNQKQESKKLIRIREYGWWEHGRRIDN